MTDDLLPEYERELAILRRSLGEFAQRYPKAATRLAISGEHSEDPHVERMIQSAALLNARAGMRLGDDYPELPTALLETLYPEYLRPFPSCSIAHFDGAGVLEKLSNPYTIERGAELKTRTRGYRFRTVYDVVLAPLRVASACYAPATSAPPNVRLPENTTGIASITFTALTSKPALSGNLPNRLRVFVDGDRRMVASVIDTLLLRSSSAFVEHDRGEKWIALDAVPLSACGFDRDEALIARRDDSEPKFRLLLEFFSFPEKFDFIEVDLSALIRVAGAANSLTLHVPIEHLHRDSPQSAILQNLSASNFKLFCTPIVNLFATEAEPISLEAVELPVYPLLPKTVNVSDAAVYRVDAVRLSQDTAKGTAVRQVEPHQSFSHYFSHQDSEVYWIAERDGRLAEFVPGQDMLLSFVDANGQMVDVTGQQIDADLTCTNGNLPLCLTTGHSEGDLVHANQTMTGRVSMLSPPTESVARSTVRNQLWDIVAMLSAGALNLCQAGLPAFKRLLRAHTPSLAAAATRHIDSLTHLSRESALEWVQMAPQPMLVRGIRVRMAVDEALLTDCSVSAFARMLDSVLVHYAPANSFVQLVVMSARNGFELRRGRPLPGAVALL